MGTLLETYMTTADAAEVLGVSRRRVQQYVTEGRLSSLVFGRSMMLKRSEVRDLSGDMPKLGRPRNAKGK